MKQKNTENNLPANPASALVSEVLNRIDSEKITPTAWWRFACMNCLVWIAWGVTVVVGAVAVAVLVYVGNRSRFELFEATHDTFLSFLLRVLPFVWVFTFVIMIIFAYTNMRHTKCGYRYPLWRMLAGSTVLSIGIGILLSMFGVGYLIDTQFAKTMPLYTSLEYMEMSLWQMPEEGRLVGVLQKFDTDEQTYTLLDANKQYWVILAEELGDRDIEILQSGAEVRIIGTTTDAAKGIFYACGVFPWRFDEDLTTEDLSRNRKVFEERMYAHMEKAEIAKRKNKHMQVDTSSSNTDTRSSNVCANLLTVRRMKI